MNNTPLLSLLLLCCLPISLWCQQDYNAFYREMNPVVDSLSYEQNVALLSDFLSAAESEGDTLRIIHGNMYFAGIYMEHGDFVAASRHLIEASSWAEKQQNLLLLGRISHKKAVVNIRLIDYPLAIEHFEEALRYHVAARDSQYLGLTYEQMGATYGYNEQYEEAIVYYDLALPMIETYGTQNELAVGYANYGNVLSYKGDRLAAVEKYETAISMNMALGDLYQLVPVQQNLAGELLVLEQYDRAFDLYYNCLRLNRKNDWSHYMIYTYQGLYAGHNDLGRLDSALFYYEAYQELKDSIIGGEVQTEIHDLENTIEIQQKEIALLEQKELTAQQRRRTKDQAITFSILLFLASVGAISFYLQKRRSARRLEENRKSLHRLVRMLQSKNAELRVLQEQFQPSSDKLKEESGENLEIDPINTRILTPDDWIGFKELFERSYPGFLRRFRSRFPEMSEAEERLFLLLKLQLTSREIANTLGIQAESVKKTRSRLRKRLQLERADSLEEYVLAFSKN